MYTQWTCRRERKFGDFQVSQGPLNASVVVDGTRVYASHNRENTDTTVMGRVVCIDGTGRGDITKTHELWRVDGIEAGYSSPAIADGRLYVVDSAANLHCLDGETGEVHWTHSLGTVGKGSPVVADGKIYVTEVNGHFHILQPGESECKTLSTIQIEREPGHYAEIYGSPAIADGKVYFTTEEGLYCLGVQGASASTSSQVVSGSAGLKMSSGAPASIQITPTEVLAQPGDNLQFEARPFDDGGAIVTGSGKVEWSLNGLLGVIDENGKLTLESNAVGQAGTVSAKIGDIQTSARVRVIPPLPWQEDFESIEVGKSPPHWVRATNRFAVREMDGNKILVKPPARRGLHRSNVYLGPPSMKNYIVQVDLLGTKLSETCQIWDSSPIVIPLRCRAITNGCRCYRGDQISEWQNGSILSGKPNVWYTMKMRVDIVDDIAHVKGKVWTKGEPEPEEWTIIVEDLLPNREGSPGIYGYSPAEVYYDNLKVWGN